jgi:hypothetical protein
VFTTRWAVDPVVRDVDVQKAHPTAEAARAAFVAGRDCRVIEVTERGRRPLDPGA